MCDIFSKQNPGYFDANQQGEHECDGDGGDTNKSPGSTIFPHLAISGERGLMLYHVLAGRRDRILV